MSKFILQRKCTQIIQKLEKVTFSAQLEKSEKPPVKEKGKRKENKKVEKKQKSAKK